MPPIPKKTSAVKLPLICQIGEKEFRRRQNRWKRRYPNLSAWTKAHPGEAAGYCANVPSVRYWLRRSSKGNEFPEWTFGKMPEYAERFVCELTREEYCELKGIDSPPTGKIVQPTWPSFPENWKEANPKSRETVLKDIKTLMHKYTIRVEELSL